MSPDDAVSPEVQPAAEAEEAKPKKSMKERMAFMSKGGEKMDKVPVFNKIPKSFRLLVVLLIVVVVIIAGVSIAFWGGGGDGSPDNGGGKTINPAKLSDWEWTPPGGIMQQPLLNEGSAAPFSLSSLIATNGTVFVDYVEVTITWQDEPDGSIGPRQKENEPDTFQLEINSSANVSAMSQEVSNTHGSTATITLSLDIGSMSDYSYLVIGNVSDDAKLPDDVMESDINIIVHMINAGDHHSSPEFLYINDFGNDYTLEIKVSGKELPE